MGPADIPIIMLHDLRRISVRSHVTGTLLSFCRAVLIIYEMLTLKAPHHTDYTNIEKITDKMYNKTTI